jgi:hypothetical protein
MFRRSFASSFASAALMKPMTAATMRPALISAPMYQLPLFNVVQSAAFGRYGGRKMRKHMYESSLPKPPVQFPLNEQGKPIPAEIYALSIDTTLTPEQKDYAEKMKRKFYGPRKERCKHQYPR